ncbi:MAG: hypothetical protein DDT27_00113 [Dehalococcoidia bacterium]|nr:hypothetical protein [Chloroflexota bacterium]
MNPERAHLVDSSVDSFQAVKLLDKLDGDLLSDTGYSRDIIRLIAFEALQVGKLLWSEAVSLLYRCFIVKLSVTERAPGPGKKHLDTGGDKLQGIGIAGYDDRIDPLCAGLLAESTKNIVGLVAFHLKGEDAEGLDQLANDGEL